VSSSVLMINLNEHRLIDRWYIEEGINCIDYLAFPDGGIIFAFGTNTGKLLIRIDWEELPSAFECKSSVTSIKFSSDGYYMIASCIDGRVYLFAFSNGSYFQFPPRELAFESEAVVDMALTDENKILLLVGNKGTLYKIDLPELKYRTAVQESDRFSLKQLMLSQTSHDKPDRQEVSGITVMGNNLSYLVFAGAQGNLELWRQSSELDSGSASVHSHHCGRINSMSVSQYQNCIVTLGNLDGALIDWKGRLASSSDLRRG
jgi:WD40 repeat protein